MRRHHDRGPPTSPYLRDVHGPEERSLRDDAGHEQPDLPADVPDGGQPAQVSEAFPQKQHEEGSPGDKQRHTERVTE